MNTPITITHAPVTRPITHFISDVAIPPLPRPKMPLQRRSDPYGLHRITEQTAAYFGITVADMMLKTKKERIAWPRQIAMYLAAELSNVRLTIIASHFGKVHATVISARDKVGSRIGIDKRSKAQVRAIIETL